MEKVEIKLTSEANELYFPLVTQSTKESSGYDVKVNSFVELRKLGLTNESIRPSTDCLTVKIKSQRF